MINTQKKTRFPDGIYWAAIGVLALAAVIQLLTSGVHPFLAGLVGWYFMLIGVPVGSNRYGLWFALLVSVTFSSLVIAGAVLWLTGATITIGVP